MTDSVLADDILYGVEKIADFLGCSRRRVYYMIGRGQIPTFKFGNIHCARPSTLLRHIESMEAAGTAEPVS